MVVLLFCLETISKKFDAVESTEVSFKGNVYNFLDDYNAIDNSDILIIHKYSQVMVENKIKWCSCLLSKIIDLNLVELNCYPFMISLDKCNLS